MNIKKLSKGEFAHAIRAGRGSALLHVRHYGDEGIESELLKACLYDLRFDFSVESCRSAWLAQMIDSCRKPELYRQQIANALKIPHRFRGSFEQLINLASEFFERGYGEFKKTLVDFRTLDDPELLFELPTCWMDVAGMTGFEHAARMLVEKDADEWDYTGLWSYFADCVGESDAKDSIEKRMKEDDDFSQFWTQFGKLFLGEDDEPVLRTHENPWTIEKLIAAIQTGLPANTYSRRLTSLGRKASDDEVEAVFSLLENETDVTKIIQLSKFFSSRAFPRVSSQLLEQVFTQNPNLRRVLRNAFSNVKSPLVRAAALKAMEKSDKDDLLTGMTLLESNYDKSDIDVMQETLTKFKTSNYRHWASAAALTWCENGSDARLSEVLKLAYTTTPCGLCRCSILRLLVEREQAPAEFLFESQWDANIDTRFFARGAFTDSRGTRSSKLCKRIEARWMVRSGDYS